MKGRSFWQQCLQPFGSLKVLSDGRTFGTEIDCSAKSAIAQITVSGCNVWHWDDTKEKKAHLGQVAQGSCSSYSEFSNDKGKDSKAFIMPHFHMLTVRR